MRRGYLGLAALWAAALGAGATLGHWSAKDTGAFDLPLRLPAAQTRALEGAAAMSIANATWLLGSADEVRQTSQNALERLPASEGARRATLLIRMALLVESIDGQGALFKAACSSDADICSRLGEVAGEQARARAVAPGNQLPISLIPGHPPIGP